MMISNFAVVISGTTRTIKLTLKKRELKRQATLRREMRLSLKKTNRVDTEPIENFMTGGTTSRRLIYQIPCMTDKSARDTKKQDLDDA